MMKTKKSMFNKGMYKTGGMANPNAPAKVAPKAKMGGAKKTMKKMGKTK